MSTIPVYFEEHEDSPMEAGSRLGEFQFARIFLVAWADRWDFLQAMFTGGILGLPKSYSPKWTGVFADKYKIERLVNKPTNAVPYISDPASQFLEHACIAKITIEYAPLNLQDEEDNEDLPDGTWVTYSQSDSLEFVSIPGRSMKWETSDKVLPADVNPVVPQNAVRHELVWHQVETVPWAVLSTLKGKVNAAPFRIPGSGQTAATETLMLIESSAKKTFNIRSETRWEVSLVFAEKAIKALVTGAEGAIEAAGTVYGWNHQWDPETGTYDKPVTEAGDTMFEPADLTAIFA